MNFTHYVRQLITLVLIAGMLYISPPVSASGQGEMKVTLSFKDAPVSKVFKGIEKQTGLVFMYNTNQIQDNYRVSIYVKKALLNDVLKDILSAKGITWEFRTKTIVLKPEKKNAIISLPDSTAGNVASGEVRDPNGTPLPGAFIYIKSTRRGTISNEKGAFTLNNVPNGATLLITYTGYIPQQVNFINNRPLHIMMDIASNKLDEAVVMAYGMTSRRLNTGSISKVTAQEISRQTVSNPLAALEGRIPGLTITQSSGAPGASYKVQVRGLGSLTNGAEPLYIVDGIPFAPNNDNINNMSSILSQGGGGLSPFSMINPADIESIEVLKDADATAIYGSRGANGVVLITTKKPKVGKTELNTNINTGFSTYTRMPEFLNTKQYLAMRKEAYKNDNLTPSATVGDPGYAPDLMIWDTTRYTDIKNLLYGGTAKQLNAGLSLTGGSEQTQFMIGGNYHRETTILPTNTSDNNGSIRFNLNHTTANKRLTIYLSSMANFDNNKLLATNGLNLQLPPNLPPLHDSTGQLNWSSGGVSFDNPLAEFLRTYNAITNNYLTNLVLSYKILDGLTFRTSGGYNIMNTKEKQLLPMASYNPMTNPSGFASFANSDYRSWIIEPQLEYSNTILKGKLNVLIGATWQENKRDNVYIALNGYTSDNLLGSIGAGPNLYNKSSSTTQYKYEAMFSRINYAYANKYIINLTGRRDGSSRFGPGKRFSNFGAFGLAWIFSNESFIVQNTSFLSYGKLRGSYGITGNDQIGDYKYLPTWTASNVQPYQGNVAIRPDNLFNPNFNWERNKKMEIAVDLGFMRDKILLSAAYYNNRSDNQLVNYSLPGQTGFPSITKNLPALIVNKGIELELSYKVINSTSFKWAINANLTIPSNKLASFPNLSTSPYWYKYDVGRSTSALKRFKFTGVDTKTGLFTFDDYNHDNIINTFDAQYIGKLDPDYFGGLSSEFSYKNFQLNILFSFKKQLGRLLDYSTQYYPGSMANQLTSVLNRWQVIGDNTPNGKFTATTYSDAYRQDILFTGSSGVYGDASFIRLKNICFTYILPNRYLRLIGLKSGKIFLQGQNLLTFTNYMADPETQNIYAIPPLKTIAGGMQITL